MPEGPNDERYRVLLTSLAEGRVVPFLGAGVNLCPNGRELASLLAQRFGYSGPNADGLLEVAQYVEVDLAVFSPDGLRVLTASEDNTARVRDVSEHIPERLLTRDPCRDFTCQERVEYLHEALPCPEPASQP